MQLKRVFHCIAAMDSKRGIGKNNDLPWHLPNEYKHFVRTTKSVVNPEKQNAVILGKNTWFSVPEKFRPLKGRLNVVISSTLKTEDLPENVKLCRSLPDAVDLLSSAPYNNTIEEIFIVGGASLYKEGMASELCKRIYITKIDGDFECDVFYPEFDTEVYKEITLDNVSQEIQEEKGIKYTFHVYEKP